MRLFRASPAEYLRDKHVIATLGNFDGVHLGHQALLQRVADFKAVQSAKSGVPVEAVALSFYPQPGSVLGRIKQKAAITSLRQKLSVFAAQGIDLTYLIHFTPALAALSAAKFVDEILIAELQVRHLVIGHDAGLGSGRGGNAAFLAERFGRSGRTVEVVPFVEVDGERISSGRIRQLIEQGDVRRVRACLGRGFALDGRIVPGMRRGTQIGIPTANIRPPQRVLPKGGVYATLVRMENKQFFGVTNIGVRPTFAGETRSIETHILDVDFGELYGRRIEVEFVEYLRPEQKFSDGAALVRQIRVDIEHAREVLAVQRPTLQRSFSALSDLQLCTYG